jgi:hypothetical protein
MRDGSYLINLEATTTAITVSSHYRHFVMPMRICWLRARSNLLFARAATAKIPPKPHPRNCLQVIEDKHDILSVPAHNRLVNRANFR